MPPVSGLLVEAHSVLPGAGDFANGLLHPFFTPAHGLLLLALGLWLGQRTPLALRLPLLTFAPVCALALAFTGLHPFAFNFQPLLATLACAAGLLVALDQPLPQPAQILLFAASALALGLDSGADSSTGHSIVIILCGTWVSLTLLVLNIAFYSSLLPRPAWVMIGLRVMGSWLSAISLLLIAFAFRKQ